MTISVILSLRTVPPHPRAEFEYANEKRKEKQPLKLKMRGEGDGRSNGASDASGWVDLTKKEGGQDTRPPPSFPE